jgi:hypothetical protein
MHIKDSKDFEFTDYHEFEIEIKVTGFTPERPAPACSNHDSPAFSDCGDSAEWNEVTMFFHLKKERFNVEKNKQEVVKELIVPVPEEIVNFLLENYDLEETIYGKGHELCNDEPEHNYDED